MMPGTPRFTLFPYTTLFRSKMETGGGIGPKTAAVIKMLRGIVDVVSTHAPERVEPVLQNMAAAIGQFSPEMLLAFLEKRRSDRKSTRLNSSHITTSYAVFCL